MFAGLKGIAGSDARNAVAAVAEHVGLTEKLHVH
eukprot:SAG22_NODE_18495_length_286_cov_0.914439_2_plen_33_part_01